MKKKKLMNIVVLLVILLFMNIPVVSAVELSNIRVVDLTDTSATIKWDTDETSDSFVSYGENEEDLKTVGDASQVTDHQIFLENLQKETSYQYKVKSGDEESSIDSFTTPEPDVTPPSLDIKIPTSIQGNILSLTGKAEIGAKINLYINDLLSSSTISKIKIAPEILQSVVGDAISNLQGDGFFTFSNIPLKDNEKNKVRVEAVDKAGNNISVEETIFADTSKPKLELEKLPSLIGKKKITLKGKISENSSYEIFVNGRSAETGSGIKIDDEVTLKEGENKIKIVLTDNAGRISEQEFTITSDTKDPTIKFDFSRGKEFYQGRAESDITGTTEPGSDVYLYVFRPLGYEFTPKFDRAWEKVTADKDGNFIFSEVNFERQPIRIESLSPKLVPSGLQRESIFPIEQIKTQQHFTYHIYLIAEDRIGKTGFAKKLVTVNTCFSADSDFEVQSLARFQAPLRLNPTLLDEGREVVTSVFNLSYRGSGVSAIGQDAFQIQSVQFNKACTQGMLDDEGTKLGCTLFPAQPQRTPNAQRTSWYLSANLHTSEKLSEKKEDYWNEFKKRQIVMPLKIQIRYREHLGNGEMSDTKVQTSCYDLSYFVDIPIDSKDLIPDFLAEEGLDAVEWTIDKIDLILPYLEKAILIIGIGWVSSFLGRLATRYARIVTSKLETFFSKGNPDGESCPGDQQKYYLESTIEHWKELSDQGLLEGEGSLREDWDDPEKSLDKLCPKTASLWKAEAVLDQAYRWSGDRVLCRAVPAGWTSTKDKHEVDTVIAAQNQCTSSSRGVPLQEIENCQKLIEENKNIARANSKAAKLVADGEFTCYRNGNFLYTVDPVGEETVLSNGGTVLKLELVHDFGLNLQQAELYAGQSDLLAYRPSGGDQFIIGQDKSCKAACRNPRRPGYKADIENSVQNVGATGKTAQYGCYKEGVDPTSREDTLVGSSGPGLTTKKFSAGYTNDCFIDLEEEDGEFIGKGSGEDGSTGLLQCVCALDEKRKDLSVQARTAIKETEEGVSEDWVYRQDQVFVTTNRRFGTYYPEWRYYGGRDFSSAFGADYLIDYFREEKQVHQVSPNTQFLGAYQTMCLSRIRAHLITLKSILEGLRNCIQEAKITGLRDAGVCKTLFAQHVCGLIYKTIAYFFTSCSPYSFSDSEEGVLGGVGAVTDATFGSIGEAMQSSIDDVKRDYGNAQLNNYFASGAQGFTESLCMAAFGYDWPLGADFILDAAYAVPGKSTVHVVPAHRELATFDPTSGNAVYNYEIGAMILPGCKIRSYDVSLKCIGQEDVATSGGGQRPGVQCGKQGCDCLQIQEQSGVLEGDKTHRLEGGQGLDLRQNEFFSVPIPSPQKVNKPFRYDHVVVQLNLDPFEKGNEDACFDEGYKDGKFYFPIVDISPPGVGVCQVQPLTGKYFCPEFVELFGGGSGAYLQDPYISCYNQETTSWVNCDTKNLYTKGDNIRIRANVFTDGKKYCLKSSTSGIPGSENVPQYQQLPIGIAGFFPVELPTPGQVSPTMFKGATTTIVLAGGDKSCESKLNIEKFPDKNLDTKTLTFGYEKIGENYKVTVPAGVEVINTPYTRRTNDGSLLRSGGDLLSEVDVRGAEFEYNGLQFKNIIGTPTSIKSSCSYQVRPAAGTSFAQNSRTIFATTELLLPDATGNCFNAKAPVKVSIGKNKHRQAIKLQLEPEISRVASEMHADFSKSNYLAVKSRAEGLINREEADIEDAVAIYYLVATHLKQSEQSSVKWQDSVGTEVCHLVGLFKNRDDGKLDEYPDEVKTYAEYLKIEKYLGEINKEGQCGVPGYE